MAKRKCRLLMCPTPCARDRGLLNNPSEVLSGAKRRMPAPASIRQRDIMRTRRGRARLAQRDFEEGRNAALARTVISSPRRRSFQARPQGIVHRMGRSKGGISISATFDLETVFDLGMAAREAQDISFPEGRPRAVVFAPPTPAKKEWCRRQGEFITRLLGVHICVKIVLPLTGSNIDGSVSTPPQQFGGDRSAHGARSAYFSTKHGRSAMAPRRPPPRAVRRSADSRLAGAKPREGAQRASGCRGFRGLL